MEKEDFVYDLARTAEHYNIMIWTIFSVGVALSLFILYIVWPLKTDLGSMHFAMSFLGFLVLFYCILTIESFGQKRILMYEIYFKKIKEINKIDLKEKISKLPFFRIEWIAEIILFLIASIYIFLYFFIWVNHSLELYTKSLIKYLAPIMTILSLVLLFIIIFNWIRRPINRIGNLIERIRRAILFGKLRSYEDILRK